MRNQRRATISDVRTRFVTNQVGDHTVIFTLRDRFDRQGEELGAPQAASDQHGDHCMITSCAWSRNVRMSEKPSTLFRRQPVAEADANAADPFTRRMPAASSGLRRPPSAASYAIRRTAARRRLIVEGAYWRCSR